MSSLLRRPTRADVGAPQPRERDATRLVGPVAETERHTLRRLVERDPLVNAVLSSRLDAIGSLSPRRLGGTVLGVRDGEDELVAAAFHGGNLLPVDGDPDSWRALGRQLATDVRVCSSIVGPATAVSAMWDEMAGHWTTPRTVRLRQPLLALTDTSALTDRDPEVRLVLPAEVDRYVPAAAAMFTEELGISPYHCSRAGDYRRRVAGLVRDRRAFARFDSDGEVMFKADLGAVSRHTCQIQGVWVRPDLRGVGIGTRAMATVLAHALTLTPTVSLYVNDFNTAARGMYERLGMHEVGTLATILF